LFPFLQVDGYTNDHCLCRWTIFVMDQLTLSFFGAFNVRLGADPLINFRSAKTQGLLIYLALTQQQAHNRNVLAALFWPNEPEDRAKHNLRHSLYRLRQLLGDDDSEKEPFLLINRATAQFNPASQYSLDVTGFLSAVKDGALETAVTHYNGDLLPGFSCDSLPFDDWLRAERERLHRLALDALFECTALSLTRGDYANGQRLARQQLTLEPWREEAHQQLMQALALLGDRSGALAQYEKCRRVLDDELGVEPTAATKTLFTRIRDQQLAPETPHQADAPQPLKIPFVGRHQEYEALVKAYQQTTSSTLQIVSLVGNAGMGKTRLAQQFLVWAVTQGADVLYGRSYETSAGLSYQPLTHLLRQRIERENAPEDLLSDLWLSQLTRLLPELRERYPDLPPPTQEENSARQHLFEAITRLGQALAARRPVVLFIDDWHWADDASRDVLQYAAQRWVEQQAPILILLTLRQEALTASPALQSWFNQLKRAVAAEQLYLDKLSQTETAQLLHLLLSSETTNGDGIDSSSSLALFSNWLFQETGGQPLFLTEALKVLVEDGVVRSGSNTAVSTDSKQAVWQLDWSRFDAQRAESRVLAGIREIIQGWLTRLSARAVECLTATAVLAQEASFDNLCRVSGLEELQAVNALEELLNRQLLLETNDAKTMARDPIYAFSHQKISEVVYAEAGTARRRMLHRRTFEALQGGRVPAADLAHHALNAGLLAETIRYSLIAGNEAMSLFAHHVAIAHYLTVQEIVDQEAWPDAVSGADRQAFYTSLGRAYELTDAWPKAQKLYEAMIAHAQKIGAAAMECQGLNYLAAVHINGVLKYQQAVGLLEQARTVAQQHGDQRGLAETELNTSRANAFSGTPKRALYHGEIALNIARELGHPQLLANCLATLSMINSQLRQWQMAEIYATEARDQYATADNQVLAADSQRLISICQLYVGYPQKTVDSLQKMLDFYQQIENLWGEAESARMLAQAHLELGHYGQAITLAKQGVDQARKMVQQMAMVDLALAAWATVQRTVMALDIARDALLEVLKEDSERGIISFVKDWVLSELCALHAVAGEWDQAVSYAKQRLQSREDKSLLSMGLTGWYEIEALLRYGDSDLAQVEVRQISELVGENRRYQLPLLRSQAALAQWDGDVAQAISHLEAALALAQEMGLPGEAWPILGELGRLYGELGEQAMAREAYGEAGVIIRRLAETIDEVALREGFVTAVSVRSVLEASKAN